MSLSRRQVLLGGAAGVLGCRGCGSAQPGQSHPSGVDESTGGGAGAPLATAGERRLLVGADLEGVKARVRAGDPAFERLKAHVDSRRGRGDGRSAGAENAAVMYLVTGDPSYAKVGLAGARAAMALDIRRGSYLHIGDILRPIALVLDHCGEALEPAEANALADFLARGVHELWFDNQGHGWGLADPGNNYHMAFIEATAFAGHALARRGDVRARRFLAKLEEVMEGPKGVLAYLRERGEGGDWHEGANYGQRAKQRLFIALAAIASMGGRRYFDDHRFFADSITFALYQLQPDLRSIHPAGDLAREAAMLVSPYDRDVVQLATYWIRSEPEQALGRWYLRNVAKSYETGSFSFDDGLYRDLLFPTVGAERSPDTLPKSFVAKGTGFATVRSGWDADATCLCVAGSPRIDQSHAHLDVGSFTLFKGGWQALDAATLSRTGLTWEAGAHNMVHVEGHERRNSRVGGLLAWSHERDRTYASVDASGLFRRRDGGVTRVLVEEYTRELLYLGPNTLVVYDRVGSDAAVRYNLRTHFAERPRQVASGLFQARQGRGGISLAVVRGGAQAVHADTDLAEGGSRTFRVEVEPDGTPGRFLSALRVALGGPPELEALAVESDDPIDGVAFDDVVVVFSALPRGRSLPGGASYRVPGPALRRTHWFVNTGGPLDVRTRDAGSVVHIEPGSGHRPDSAGIVRYVV